MRTVSLLFLLLLLSWYQIDGVVVEPCEFQMIALMRLAAPLAIFTILLDILGLMARFLERRQQREIRDEEWMERWIGRAMDGAQSSIR